MFSIELRLSVNICRSAFVARIIHLLISSANNGVPKPSSMAAPKTKRGTATEHADVQAERDQNHMEAAQADLVDDERMFLLAGIMLFRLVPKQG